MHIRRISVAKYPYPYPYPFKQGNYYPYPIRIRENCGYPQNIYPRIHIRASLLQCIETLRLSKLTYLFTCKSRRQSRIKIKDEKRQKLKLT